MSASTPSYAARSRKRRPCQGWERNSSFSESEIGRLQADGHPPPASIAVGLDGFTIDTLYAAFSSPVITAWVSFEYQSHCSCGCRLRSIVASNWRFIRLANVKEQRGEWN